MPTPRPRAAGPLAIVSMLLLAGFAGCLSSEGTEPLQASDAEAQIPWCEHPWPCADGTEWPAGLEGPFELEQRREIEITMRDGTVLRGWADLPAVPDGVGVPVVLRALPYLGQTYPAPDMATDPYARYGGSFPRVALVEAGYAAVQISVRGSGASDGCFEHHGLDEQRDIAEVVTWLGEQPWSNGRVGMTGLSYGGTTPWFAAIHAPKALKTIVPIGIITDLYTFYHTPQGASISAGGYHMAGWLAINSLAPPLLTEPATAASHPSRAEDRWCEDARHQIEGSLTEFHGDTRDGRFWDDRRTLDDLANVSAAVWTVHGLQDISGHAFQEDLVWNAIPASTPQSMLLGQWGHVSPPTPDWESRLLDWFDFWLKGAGEPPAQIDRVDYEALGGEHRSSSAWPPAEAHREALYLTPTGLEGEPAAGLLEFQAAPHPGGPYRMLCDALAHKQGTVQDPSGLGLVAWSEPAQADTVIAGNPFALLPVEVDQAGGLVSVHVYEVAPEATCDGTDQSGPGFHGSLEDDVHLVTRGAADLRFLDGNYEAAAFPVHDRTPVRVDLHNTAHRVPAGHQLAVVVSYGDSGHRATSEVYTPRVVLEATSAVDDAHLVLPLVEGTLGGQGPPRDTYPDRPFAAPAPADRSAMR